MQSGKGPSRKHSWKMFDRVADRYDFLNCILSGGIDTFWRKKVAAFLPECNGQRVLDLATGTGDQVLSLFHASSRVRVAVGMDPAERMLEIGRRKIERAGLSDAVHLMRGSATAIPAKNEHFDVVTISFGIRNVTDVSASLREAYRVLKPSGRFLILEFSLPRSPLICAIYLVYLRNVLPRVGALISGDAFAYRYLNETIETFPYGRRFCRLLSQAGFKAVFARSLPLGIVTVYHGQKPELTGRILPKCGSYVHSG